MTTTRRNVLTTALFGASYIGLRSLVTGIPVAILAKGRKAFADGTVDTCANSAAAQFVIISTSGSGDPINANAPGTYGPSDIFHCPDVAGQPSMVGTNMTVNGVKTMGALPWATLLPQPVLDKTCFWHIMTNTPVHPKETDVLKLLDTTTPNEMLPSLLGKQLQPCLGTIQAQPISVGASTPSEGLSFDGADLPNIPPTALAAMLTNPTKSPLSNLNALQSLRDDTLGKLNAIYKTSATPAQSKYIDSLVTSQSQVRSINQKLLSMLSTLPTDPVEAQITAALALIQMKVTPVITIHIPFGGDNHSDPTFNNEATQTTSGVGHIASLMSQLQTLGLDQQVTFMTLNVFGRTIGAYNNAGRQHNQYHQVSLTISSRIKGGIVGGIAHQTIGGQTDYGCLPINSSSGAGDPNGDIVQTDTLASFGKTVLASVGVDSATIDSVIGTGKVVSGVLPS
ncbi:MAG TPA: hypothetical protein VLX92_12955 [Kofleriaceae bacterium]|nr:hypothetical protein [Kofleriaceae bacterium]